MLNKFKRAESVNHRHAHRTNALAELIRQRPTCMAVVDCLGFVNSDGRLIGKESPDRYDVRSFQHVAVYKFPVVSFNERGLSAINPDPSHA